MYAGLGLVTEVRKMRIGDRCQVRVLGPAEERGNVEAEDHAVTPRMTRMASGSSGAAS
jgi:hypothetical protein